METTVKATIGTQTQKWRVHPRRDGDLILTSDVGIAIVDTRAKVALTGPTLKALEGYEDRQLIQLRQDVVDRLLDAEEMTKSSHLPVCRIDLCERGVAVVQG